MTTITTQALAVIEPRTQAYEEAHQDPARPVVAPHRPVHPMWACEEACGAVELTVLSRRHHLVDVLRQYGPAAVVLTPLGLPITMALVPGGSSVTGLVTVPVLMAGAAVIGMAWGCLRDVDRVVTIPDEVAAQIELIGLNNGGEAR